MSEKIRRSINILLVEDRPEDVRLTQEAFKLVSSVKNLSVAKDGVEAMAYLKREGVYQKCTRPDLILLDLNLPKKTGLEVLKEIKQDSKLKNIPVIMLTTSCAEEDVAKCYELHANCYIVKPVDLNEFVECVKAIEHFWMNTVKLPNEIDE